MNLLSSSFEDFLPPDSPDPRRVTPVTGGGVPPVLLQYWHIVTRRRWILASIALACLVVGLVITLLMPPLYTARAQMEIERKQKQVTNVQGLEAEQTGSDMEFYSTQYSLMRTRPVAERVVRDLRLDQNAEFFGAHGVDMAVVDEENGGARSRSARVAREKLAIGLVLRNVDISPVRTSRLVNINYTSRVPDMSSRIANGWAAAFIAVSMDRQFASTADARRFLEQRLATLKERLEQSERQAVAFAAQADIVTLDQVRDAEGRTQTNRTLAAENLDALNTALNAAIDLRVLAESRRGGGALATEALTSTSVAALRQQRAQVAAERAKLLSQFEPGYPDIQAATQQLGSLDAAIGQEVRRISGSREQEYRQAVARENALRGQVETLRAGLSNQQRASIEHNIYQREADTNRQLYDALLQRYKEIGVAGTIGVNNISVVEPAQIPTSTSSPNIFLNLLLAMVFGTILGIGAAIALEQLDEGVRDPSQIQAALGLPVLGNTPAVEGDVLQEINDTKSHLYDAYFSIRSNLAFATSHGFPRSLSITSTRPAEGKSSTSFALAAILGRTDKKVLLIDGDMRSPSVHSLTGLPNEKGLSNFLAGEDDWRGLIHQSDFKGLSVISAGPTPPSAAELLSGDRLRRLINEVMAEFDHVIIDSPPILGLTDAPILSRAVEGCLLVVESEGVALRGIRASIARLQMVHANIVGVVLTKLAQRSSGYGDGYGYGYGYGYGGERYGEVSKA